MAKTNAKIKIDSKKGYIFANYGQSAAELIISCQAYMLGDEYSFIVFRNEKVSLFSIECRGIRLRFHQGTSKCTC